MSDAVLNFFSSLITRDLDKAYWIGVEDNSDVLTPVYHLYDSEPEVDFAVPFDLLLLD